jgi:hypothetical protein
MDNVVYVILTPVPNPLMRNKDVKAAITKIIYLKAQAMTWTFDLGKLILLLDHQITM